MQPSSLVAMVTLFNPLCPPPSRSYLNCFRYPFYFVSLYKMCDRVDSSSFQMYPQVLMKSATNGKRGAGTYLLIGAQVANPLPVPVPESKHDTLSVSPLTAY